MFKLFPFNYRCKGILEELALFSVSQKVHLECISGKQCKTVYINVFLILGRMVVPNYLPL